MAFLDLQRIAAESTEGKAASGKVQALTQKKSAELQDKTKSLQGNQQKLQQGGAVLNEAARAQTQKEIDRLTVEIDRFQEDANAEVQELQQSLQAEFQEKLRPVVDAMVKELAIGLLFSAGDAGAIYVDPSLDITGEVIKRFDSGKYVAARSRRAGHCETRGACAIDRKTRCAPSHAAGSGRLRLRRRSRPQRRLRLRRRSRRLLRPRNRREASAHKRAESRNLNSALRSWLFALSDFLSPTVSLDVSVLLDRLCYRHPSVLVDAIDEHEPGSGSSRTRTSRSTRIFPGHFPGVPLMLAS
jgi:Skp family chaperone for outer membrane proteins